MVSDDPTAPQPLTGDEVAESKMRCEGDEWYVDAFVTTLRWVATVEQLQAENAAKTQRLEAQRAEVDRLTADLATTTSQRDAADACLRRWNDDLDGTWFPDSTTVTWELVDTNEWVAIRREPMAPAEADALARAAQPQEGP